jgi:hypothetical protein
MSNSWSFTVLAEPGSLDRDAVGRVFATARRHGFADAVAEHGAVFGSTAEGDEITFPTLQAATDYLAANDGLVVLWNPALADEQGPQDIGITIHHADPAAAVASTIGDDKLCRFDEVSFCVTGSMLSTSQLRGPLYAVLGAMFETIVVGEDAAFGYLLDEYTAEELLPATAMGGLLPCADLPLVLGWVNWIGSGHAGLIDDATVAALGADGRRVGRGVLLDLGLPWETPWQKVAAKNAVWRRLREAQT